MIFGVHPGLDPLPPPPLPVVPGGMPNDGPGLLDGGAAVDWRADGAGAGLVLCCGFSGGLGVLKG